MRWALLFTFLPLLAFADTGTELQQTCKKPEIGYAYCLGYITGATQALSTASSRPAEKQSPSASNPPGRFCLPQGVSNVQTMQAVIRYMDEHPEQLRLSAETLVAYALQAAYPCSTKQ